MTTRFYVVSSQLKGTTLTWYGDHPPRSIDSFDTLIEHFCAQYTNYKSHRMTSAALVSLQQADDKSSKKIHGQIWRHSRQIQNLNPEVALHSMLLALCPNKFVDSVCKPR